MKGSIMSTRKESIQKRIARERKPRVHLEYDVQIGDATEKKELPFVVGVLGNFSGDASVDLPILQDRKAISVSLDNFGDVMSKIKPALELNVPNVITDQGGSLNLAIEFNSIEDFTPDNIVQNIEPLRKLVEVRNNLKELVTKADENRLLVKQLNDIIENEDNRNNIVGELKKINS